MRLSRCIGSFCAGVSALLLSGQSLAREPFTLSFEHVRNLKDGDAETISYLTECADSEWVCGMVAGSYYRKRGQIGRAESLFKKALASGGARAAESLAHMYIREQDPVEAYAWGQLAYALLTRDGELSERERRDLPSFNFVALAYQGLDEAQRREAEDRAAEIVDAWWDRYHRARQARDKERGNWEIEITNQPHPEYPRELAIHGIQGFAIVYAEVDRDGHVIDAVALDASHEPFAAASVEAIRSWQFRIEGDSDRRRFPVTEQIIFHLEEM